MEDAAQGAADKRAAIIAAAMAVFCQYGFRRTSMEDVARAAGMSRPALYQHFRNKEAIARALIAGYFDRAEAAMRAALAGPGTVQDRLSAAFAAKIGPEMAQALNSPHGAELIDIHASLAQDIVSEGAGRMVQVLADWLTEEVRAGRITLTAPPAEVATLILRLLESLKNQGFDDFVVARDRLARLLAGGLVAGTV